METGEPKPENHAGNDEAARELDCLVTIGALVGVIAHEINNPLAGIQNAFMLVRDAIPPSHPHYVYVGAIDRELRRIAEVTRRLADAYNPERDRALGVAISTIVAEASRMASASSGTSSPAICIDGEPDREPFGAAAGLLRHSLHQVLAAAVRATEPAEPVRIEVCADGDKGDRCVRISHRAAGAPDGSIGTDHSARMLTALGAGWEIQYPEPGWREITIRVPMAPGNLQEGSR